VRNYKAVVALQSSDLHVYFRKLHRSRPHPRAARPWSSVRFVRLYHWLLFAHEAAHRRQTFVHRRLQIPEYTSWCSHLLILTQWSSATVTSGMARSEKEYFIFYIHPYNDSKNKILFTNQLHSLEAIISRMLNYRSLYTIYHNRCWTAGIKSNSVCKSFLS
jgi:hypothetical protein